jgi:hypothetical protein
MRRIVGENRLPQRDERFAILVLVASDIHE